MGRKPTGTRKYIFYSVACLIPLCLSRCAAIDELRTREEAKGIVRQGHKLLAQGYYDGALDRYWKVMSLSGQKPPGDEALFHIGLIYASSRYAKRDTKKSMDFFARVLNDWPQSPLVEQAKIWLGMLHENETMAFLVKKRQPPEPSPPQGKPPGMKTNEVAGSRDHPLRGQRLLTAGDFEGFINENQRNLSLAHPRFPKEEALFNLGLVYAHERNPKRDFSKSLDFFKRLIHDHPKSPLAEQARIWVGLLQEYESLTQVIQKLKQVDIEVEERKREKAK
ncbi:MAG: tetratricopeptide repeat protein [Thermodesulfobacteriota bacterium]